MRWTSSNVKGWTLKLALCAVAGAVVTWGVAWGCALEGFGIRDSTQDLTPLIWETRVPTHWPRPSAGGSSTHPVHDYTYRTNTNQFREAVFSWGWPCNSMAHEIQEERLVKVRDTGWRPPGAIGHVPLTIVPFGFAVDTLVFGGAVLGVVELAGFVWRRRRIAKGDCPSCGYDRGGLAEGAACPECGRGV